MSSNKPVYFLPEGNIPAQLRGDIEYLTEDHPTHRMKKALLAWRKKGIPPKGYKWLIGTWGFEATLTAALHRECGTYLLSEIRESQLVEVMWKLGMIKPE